MEKYRNFAHNSGVRSFQISKDGIIVEFIHGDQYLYDYKHPGKSHVEQMKKLAISGKGLSTYISQNIRTNYSKKLK